jgi:hypothetical protein
MTEPINDLAAALAKAQAEIQNPKFDSVNPHFKNKFASLAAVRNAIVPVFAKHGLSVLQNLTTTAEHCISCETILLHASGQSMRLGPLVMPASKADAQGYGSAATYARRYALLGTAGVAGEPDDDGNAAVASNDRAASLLAKRMKTLVGGLQKAVTENDAAAAKKIWTDTTNDEKELVWNELRSFSGLRASIKKLLGEAKSLPPNGELAPWAIEAIKVSGPDSIQKTWTIIQDAFAERDEQVPADLETVYQDRKAELGA